MNTYQVKVYRPGNVFCWEGQAVNVMDALLEARAAADPVGWKTYRSRPGSSNTAPPWMLFRREPENSLSDIGIPIQCSATRVG